MQTITSWGRTCARPSRARRCGRCRASWRGELDRKDFYNLFRERIESALVALWQGRLLGKDGGVDVFEQLKVTLPRIRFSGDTPNAKDAGRIKLTLPFVAAALLDQDNTEMSVELVNVTA